MHELIPFPGNLHGALVRRSASQQAAASLQSAARRKNPLCELSSSFGRFFGPALRSPERNGGRDRRERSFSIEITFWSFLFQVLNSGASCREAVRRIQRFWKMRSSEKALSCHTGAYCRARKRLPLPWLETLRNALSSKLTQAVEASDLWCGRRVRIIDGTSHSMPDTSENQQRWPQHCEKPGCGFPLLRVVGLFCLHSGALMASVSGAFRDAELPLARRLWPLLQKGEVLLGDRGFCAYADIALLLSRGVDSVLRLHQRRRTSAKKGRRLGRGDRLITWKRPPRSWAGAAAEMEGYCSLCEELSLRMVSWKIAIPGFRTREVTLVTTLLDPKEFPAQELRDLYLKRWGVELHYREIKMALGADVLTCKSPEMIEREVLLHQIAYNLVRCVMQEAAQECGVELGRISFTGTRDTMRQWAPVLHARAGNRERSTELYREMLEVIADDLVPERPGRSEPRAKKRRPKNYHLLTSPRRQFQHPGHRNRPMKRAA